MAALVRFGAARAWRLFASNSVRSSLIYQRNSSASYKEHLWRAWQPIISSSRFLSNESSPNEEVTNGEKVDNQIEGDTSVASTGVRRGSDYQDSRMSSDPKQGGDFKYKRQVKQLGTLLMKAQLIRTFEEILEREGKITSLQAYQVLRNCGTELQYEKPADRVELAHYFWDQLMKMGVKQDVMLYNALLSVYLQNNHNFNPMDILEKMEQSNIDPNRTTLLLLIQGYAQRGDIAGVFKVLEFMKTGGIPVTEQVFAALITAYGFNGDPESARGVFDLMRTNGLEPELDSYTALLAIYSEAGDMESIMKTVDEMQEKHVYPNRKVFVTVLDSLSKRGHHELIRQILQTPIVKSLLEGDLNDLMMAAATRGEMSSAFIFLGHMIETGSSRKMNLHPAYALLRQVIISGQPIDAILVTLSELEKLATFKNVYEDALDISFRKRDPEITQAIIQEMLQKELRVRVHYFYPLLAMYAQNQDARAAQEVVNIIGSNGFAMTGTIFRFLMQSYGNPDAKDVESFMNLSQDAPVSKYLLTVMAQLMMAAGQLDKLQKAVEYAKNENVNMRCISDAFGNYLLKRNFDPRNAVEIVKLLDSLEVTDGLSTAIHLSCHKCPKGKITSIVEFVTLLLKEGFHRHLDSRALSFVMASLADNAMPTEFYDFVRMMKEQKVDLDIHQYRQMLRMLAFDGKAEAAQFCFDKAAKLEEPSALMYSYLMQAYAHCPEGGIHAHMPKDRNMRRIIQLYDLMTGKEFKPTVRAIGGACIAHLHMGDVEKAEEVRRMHGFGQPRVKVLFQFMRNYSRSGDVAKTLEFFEELKKEMKDLDLPLLLYNNLLHVYAFHGDIESQWKVFEKIKENNLEPNQYSYSNIVRTYLLKDDIDTALKTFQDAKEEGKFIADGTCLLLLNSMARTGRLEHFENVLEDIMTNRIASGYSMKWPALLRGLMFCCLHAGKKDLAFKIQLEHEVRVEVHAFVTLSESSAKRGEVQAVLNAIEFFKENDINPAALYLPLIKAHDARKDPDAIKAVYEQLVSEGVELGPLFVQQCNKILLKYADTTFSEADPPPQAQTEQVQDELSSDDEENPMEDIREDFEEEEKSE